MSIINSVPIKSSESILLRIQEPLFPIYQGNDVWQFNQGFVVDLGADTSQNIAAISNLSQEIIGGDDSIVWARIEENPKPNPADPELAGKWKANLFNQLTTAEDPSEDGKIFIKICRLINGVINEIYYTGNIIIGAVAGDHVNANGPITDLGDLKVVKLFIDPADLSIPSYPSFADGWTTSPAKFPQLIFIDSVADGSTFGLSWTVNLREDPSTNTCYYEISAVTQ